MLDRDGAELERGAAAEHVEQLLEMIGKDTPHAGRRLTDRPDVAGWLETAGLVGSATTRLGAKARPVRAIVFDKTEGANWSLGWHQDRTVAVQERHPVSGFDRWTLKDGIHHVEPPYSIIERMVTARIHIDAVPPTNAPLKIIPGSHRLGRLDEDTIDGLVRETPAVECLADAGDVWWYRTAVVHASARASGSGHRRVLQVDFSAEDLPPPLRWRGIS